jgi:titin
LCQNSLCGPSSIWHAYYFYFPFADKPGPPGIPEFSEVTDTSVKVTWTPPEDDGGAPIKNYHLEYSTGTKWTPASLDVLTDTYLVAKRLKTDGEYQFRVCAENKVGSGPYSMNKKSINIKAPLVGDAPIMDMKLEDTTVICPDEAVLDCQIQPGTPAAEIKW